MRPESQGVVRTGQAGHALTLTSTNDTSHRRDPSLRPRYATRPSPVLRSPRTPAQQRSTSPLAYTSHLALTRATETGLPCSTHPSARVLLPIPRRNPPRVSEPTRWTWPSP